MNAFLTVLLFAAGGIFLIIAINPLILRFRNSLFRMYLGLRPLYGLRILAEWYPKLNLNLNERVSLRFVPVPWTVIESVRYATEQSQTLSGLLAPTLDSKTKAADSAIHYRRTIGNFQNVAIEQDVNAKEMLSRIQELHRLKKKAPLDDKVTADKIAEKIVSKLGPEIQKVIKQQRLGIAADEFTRIWEALQNCHFLKQYLKQKIDRIISETGGTAEDRVDLENLANQFYRERCGGEEDE